MAAPPVQGAVTRGGWDGDHHGVPELSGLLLFSPWVDITMTNSAIVDVAPRDPLLAVPGLIWAGRQWAGELRVTDPRISPLFDTLRALPPLFVYQGGRDIFLPDAKRFTARATAAGSSTQLRIFPDAFHVFVGLPILPESRRALRHAGLVITGGRRARS